MSGVSALLQPISFALNKDRMSDNDEKKKHIFQNEQFF